jgi:hypothetical protein
MIVDTLFCLFEAVKFNNIFGRTYGINHINAATTHYNLWRISEAYDVYCVFPKFVELISDKSAEGNKNYKEDKTVERTIKTVPKD